MYCPKGNTTLEQGLSKVGVVVDCCNECGGIWFDSGKLFLFVDFPDQLYNELNKAFTSKRSVSQICSRCRKTLYNANFTTLINIEKCDSCDGV